MKHLRETFTDQEFEQLKRAKDFLKLNWHDFINLLTVAPQIQDHLLAREKDIALSQEDFGPLKFAFQTYCKREAKT